MVTKATSLLQARMNRMKLSSSVPQISGLARNFFWVHSKGELVGEEKHALWRELFFSFFFKSLSDSVIHFSLWFEFVVAKFGSDATPFPTGLLVLLSAGEP